MEHKQSNNNQTRSTPSHQNMDSANTANRISARKKNIDWIGLSNIIVSLLVGVVVAIYLNFRAEQFQTDMVNLQARIQGEYNSAHLQIACPHIDCTQMFTVTNTGFGVAKSVNVVIAISSVTPLWTPFVDAIDKFRLSIRPFSASVRVTPIIDTSVNALPSGKNNAYLLALDNLGPNTSLTVSIHTDNLYQSSEGTKEYKQRYRATLYYTAAEGQALSNAKSIEEVINDFIDNNFFEIANFTMEASCASCAGDTSYARFPSFEPSVDNNNFLVTSNSETFMPTVAPTKLSNSGYDLAVSFAVDYIVPKVSNQISIPSPLYLQVNSYGSDNQSIQQCQVTDCSKFPSG